MSGDRESDEERRNGLIKTTAWLELESESEEPEEESEDEESKEEHLRRRGIIISASFSGGCMLNLRCEIPYKCV
ncbi:hypothetical protein ACTXT7_011350 [Hymenolepis weldensis]